MDMNKASEKSFVRVFFALWPLESERNQLVEWQKPLQHLCGGKAMHSETLHSTLVFIGGIGQSRLKELKLAAQEVNGRVFDVCFDRAHYWGHNHIVYAAPEVVPEHLAQLVDALELCLEKHGFDFDHRKYQPHVTLLRKAKWTDVPLPEMNSVCWQIRDFVLVQSIQQQGIANYQVLARYPLLPNRG